MDKKEFGNYLNALHVRVDSLREDPGEILVFCTPVEKVCPDECPYCHGKSLDVHKTIEKQILDVPYRHRKVFLCIPYRRYRCRNCRKIVGDQIDWIDDHSRMTKRLEQQIATECFYYSFHNVARRFFVSEPTVLALFNKYISQQDPVPAPKHIGIEPAVIEGKTYGLFLNLYTGKPVDLSEDYSSKKVFEVLDKLYGSGFPAKICMNLGDEHLEEVRNQFPESVFYYNKDSITAGMLGILSETCRNLTNSRKMSELLSLPGSRLLGYQNRQLQGLFRKYPEIEDLYLMKESFDDAITDTKFLDDWYSHVQSSAYSILNLNRDLLQNFPRMEIDYPLNLPGHGYTFKTIKSLAVYQTEH